MRALSVHLTIFKELRLDANRSFTGFWETAPREALAYNHPLGSTSLTNEGVVPSYLFSVRCSTAYSWKLP